MTPITVLYAEDDPHAREMLLKLLHHKFPALTIHTASDGREGLALFEMHRPQLILADITMPVMDGVEMARRIREIDATAYVIALTAYNDAEWQRKSEEAGFNATLTKPVEFQKLLDAVGSAVKEIEEARRLAASTHKGT